MKRSDPDRGDVADKAWVILLFFGGITFVQVALGLAIYRAFDAWSTRGTFGDMFGAVNTLFSGLAFAGVIYAILLQRRELMLQRHELKLTRTELERSAEAQEKSSQLLGEQLAVMQRSFTLEELRASGETQPIFLCTGAAKSSTTALMEFTNKGAIITVLSVKTKGDFTAEFTPMGVVMPSGKGDINFRHDNNVTPPYTLELEYLDMLGRRRSMQLECDPHQKTFAYMEKGGLA